MMHHKELVISGMGIITANANTLVEFCDVLRAGTTAIDTHPLPSPLTNPVFSIGARIDPQIDIIAHCNKLDHISDSLLKQVKRLAHKQPLLLQTAIYVALQAWLNSQLMTQTIPAQRVALIIAGSNLDTHASYQTQASFHKQPAYLNPRYALTCFDTHMMGVISELLAIQGEGFSMGGASASSLVAIHQAKHVIQSGSVDACLIIGALADLSPMQLQAFYNIGALGGEAYTDNPKAACRPFDQQHNGFIYGQGCAAIVLETAASANKRHVPLLAYLRGSSVCLDACHLSTPDKVGEIRAMQTAMADADISAAQIDYINTHGTGSVIGDDTEISAIEHVFAQCRDKVQLNATKGITGHCLYAAGMIETVATILQMQHGFLHPNSNLEQPMTNKLNLLGSTASATQAAIALNNSFGFAGINASIILQRT